jgi:hypothetical protein
MGWAERDADRQEEEFYENHFNRDYVGVLEKALEAFAEFGRVYFDPDVRGNTKEGDIYTINNRSGTASITVEMLREAMEALAWDGTKEFPRHYDWRTYGQ